MPRALTLVMALIMATVAGACGAEEAGSRRSEPSPPPPAEAPADPAPEPVVAPAPAPTPEPPPARPEPVEVEAGARLGPIRIGMSEADVRSLGLEESELDPRTRRFGPYEIAFDATGVRSVEAPMGRLERIRLCCPERVLEAGTHIHTIRDAVGDCVWQEGGGERYRCAHGGLWVETSHSLDPARYRVRIESR